MPALLVQVELDGAAGTLPHVDQAEPLAREERIVRGECEAAGSPREPEFEYYDQFPLTDNDAEALRGAIERGIAASALTVTRPGAWAPSRVDLEG